MILEHMGDILSRMEKKEEAAEYYEKAISHGHEKPEEIQSKLSQIRKAGSTAK